MRRISFILMVLALVGCGANRHLPIAEQKDSVSVVIQERVIVKDSLIYVEVPAESQATTLPNTDTSRLETSIAESEAWVSDGQLNHTLRHKPDMRLPKVITIPIYLRNKETESLEQKVIVKEVEKDFTHWQSFKMTLGTLFIGVIVIAVLLVLLRSVFKL